MLPVIREGYVTGLGTRDEYPDTVKATIKLVDPLTGVQFMHVVLHKQDAAMLPFGAKVRVTIEEMER